MIDDGAVHIDSTHKCQRPCQIAQPHASPRVSPCVSHATHTGNSINPNLTHACSHTMTAALCTCTCYVLDTRLCDRGVVPVEAFPLLSPERDCPPRSAAEKSRQNEGLHKDKGGDTCCRTA